MSRRLRRAAVVGTVAAGVAAVAVAGADPAAAHGSGRVYVSPSGGATQAGTSCDHARFNSIQAAIEAAPVRGTVVVCRGTYPGMVTVDRQVDLEGQPGAVINATGDMYGVGIATSWVTVSGLTVRDANSPDLGDGIVTAGLTQSGPTTADHVTIEHNLITGSGNAGIDLNSTTGSVARDNVSRNNGIGVNVSDDLGAPAADNLIIGNVTNRNFGGCGIALADHSGLGVYGNRIVGNISNGNGLKTPTAPDASAGSGVILASPIPHGIVRDNLIKFNVFRRNGHGGVVVHAHAPGSDFSGNVVVGNVIGANNLRQDTSDPYHTGIYLGSADPLAIVVAHNLIFNNHYGIFTAGDVTVHGAGSNRFVNVAVHMAGVPTY